MSGSFSYAVDNGCSASDRENRSLCSLYNTTSEKCGFTVDETEFLTYLTVTFHKNQYSIYRVIDFLLLKCYN